MFSAPTSFWFPRVSALVLAAAAMGSAVAWGLKLRAPLQTLPAATTPTAPLQVDAAMVARALGAAGAEAPVSEQPSLASSRMVLQGVVAGTARGGSALISVDGKPPKPVSVGGRVGDDWVLVSVASRRAVLRSAADEHAEPFALEMPLTATLLPKSPASP